MENIIVKYLEFVLACYVVRFLATRFILEFQAVIRIKKLHDY